MKLKTYLLPIAIVVLACFSSCSKTSENEVSGFGTYGDSTITEDGAVSSSELPSLLAGKDSANVKLTGEIKAVCQAKGCWMSLPVDDTKAITIKFKDYDFFVPKNSGGHQAIVEGVAFVDTISVEARKHRAQEMEKTQEEIDAITETKIEYSVIASGVIIK